MVPKLRTIHIFGPSNTNNPLFHGKFFSVEMFAYLHVLVYDLFRSYCSTEASSPVFSLFNSLNLSKPSFYYFVLSSNFSVTHDFLRCF